MHRNPVSSTTVASAGYDPEALILEIEFASGLVYRYIDVPNHVFNAFLAAPSHGTYFNRHIRGQYSFARVGSPD